MKAHRVVVIGAGVIGVTTAHALASDGHQVTLLDAASTAASASSHANGGFLSAAFCAPWAMPGLPKQAAAALLDRQAPFCWRPDGSWAQIRWLRELLNACTAEQFGKHRARMVRLALLSRACMNEVVSSTGIEFDLRTAGVLLIFRQSPTQQAIDRRLQELQGFGFDARWCDADEVRRLEPGLSNATQIDGAIYVRDDACGDCERFVQGLLAWNLSRGMAFERNVSIDALELDDGGRKLRAVRAGNKRWDADAFVFATGADTARLLRPYLHVPVVPVKGYSVTATLAPDAGPMRAIIDEASKLAVTRLGNRARLAGMAEVVGHDSRIDMSRCEQLVQQYENLYGELPDVQRSYWSGLRPMTPDGTPIIGETSIRGLYLNTGQGTYGWTLACGSARLLADVLADRPCLLDLAAYALDPQRRA